MSDLLDQLSRRCRHQPQMGGNKEQITITCALLGRLIGLAYMAQAMADDLRSPADKEQTAQFVKHEMAYVDREIGWMQEIQRGKP